MPQVLEQKVLQNALKLGRYGLAKIFNLFPMENKSFITHVATDKL